MNTNDIRFKISEVASKLIYDFLSIDPNANFNLTYEDGVIGLTGAVSVFDPEAEKGENENGNSL